MSPTRLRRPPLSRPPAAPLPSNPPRTPPSPPPAAPPPRSPPSPPPRPDVPPSIPPSTSPRPPPALPLLDPGLVALLPPSTLPKPPPFIALYASRPSRAVIHGDMPPLAEGVPRAPPCALFCMPLRISSRPIVPPECCVVRLSARSRRDRTPEYPQSSCVAPTRGCLRRRGVWLPDIRPARPWFRLRPSPRHAGR